MNPWSIPWVFFLTSERNVKGIDAWRKMQSTGICWKTNIWIGSIKQSTFNSPCTKWPCHALPLLPMSFVISCLWLGCAKVSVDESLARWATSGHPWKMHSQLPFAVTSFYEIKSLRDQRNVTFPTQFLQFFRSRLMLHIVKTTKCHSDARQWTPPQENESRLVG